MSSCIIQYLLLSFRRPLGSHSGMSKLLDLRLILDCINSFTATAAATTATVAATTATATVTVTDTCHSV